MSAAAALRAAHAAGVCITVDGADLVLEAAIPPPAAVLNDLSRHKADIVVLLRPGRKTWSAEDWRAFFDERAGIAEFEGGLSRAMAEAHASTCCVAEWLNHHPMCSLPNHCHGCGEVERVGEPLLPFGTEDTGWAWLHSRCWPDWQAVRKSEAVAALAEMGIVAPDAILSDRPEVNPEPVRQRDDSGRTTTTTFELTNAPAQRSKDLCLHVCHGVRIISDDLQWIIQTKKGKASAKSCGWRSRHFCRSREGLQLALRRLLGRNSVPANAVALIGALPEFHHLVRWLASVDKKLKQINSMEM